MGGTFLRVDSIWSWERENGANTYSSIAMAAVTKGIGSLKKVDGYQETPCLLPLWRG